MQYKNVLSKSYAIPQDKQELAIRDFLEAVISIQRLELSSLPFFAIEGEKDGALRIKYYISIENNDPGILPQGLHFDSYFGIAPMAGLMLSGDFNAQSGAAFEELHKALDENGLTAITPVFVILGGDSPFQYATFKVGYADKRFFENEAEEQSQEVTNGR